MRQERERERASESERTRESRVLILKILLQTRPNVDLTNLNKKKYEKCQSPLKLTLCTLDRKKNDVTGKIYLSSLYSQNHAAAAAATHPELMSSPSSGMELFAVNRLIFVLSLLVVPNLRTIEFLFVFVNLVQRSQIQYVHTCTQLSEHIIHSLTSALTQSLTYSLQDKSMRNRFRR